MSIESLHSHTTLSDGKLSHREAFELAEKLGYGVLAFTDHDALPNAEVLTYLETLRDRRTKWVVGIEMTSGIPPEIPPQDAYTLHIVGLFVDPTNAELLEHCRKTQLAREKKAETVCKNLIARGFKISKGEVLGNAGGDSVGLPHIVASITNKEENMILVRELMEKWRKDGEKDESVGRLYKQAIARGEDQWPYALFFNSKRYIHDVTVPIEYKLDMDESVALIRGAGGIASLAHYYFMAKDIFPTVADLLPYLRDKRLDGMEVVYNRPQGFDSGIFRKEREEIKMLLQETDALATGGADAHKQEDFVNFAEDKSLSGETIGMTTEILRKRPDISKRWTSFV